MNNQIKIEEFLSDDRNMHAKNKKQSVALNQFTSNARNRVSLNKAQSEIKNTFNTDERNRYSLTRKQSEIQSNFKSVCDNEQKNEMENHHKSIWNNKHIQQNNESRLEYKRTLSNDAMVDSKLKCETISESKRVFESRMTNASPLNSFNEVLQTFAHKTYKMAKSDSADHQEQLNALKEAFNQNILMDAKEHFDRLHEFMDTNEKSIEIYDCV